ncbi:right-handed parallel beta-helix repeat-containing protein [Pengzhenrongella sicca]|uniref:Right handed beta helix domain-containing protein n=1 Tax=Pengzhenrongella sicca TaxID=2819238 RepID=A0A8A4ZCJ5_9MICO|nr:hypothetical protein [Pengzhenrongella sicca]QTE29652.1 hypothetical protein J4E96_00890 [Pengzhenrongella sicca]
MPSPRRPNRARPPLGGAPVRARGRRCLAGLAVLAGLLVLGGCAGDAPPPAPAPSWSPLDSATDRPGPASTGVPAGVVLTPSEGVRVTEDGAVLDGLDVAGCVVVAADDVTIRNSRITCLDAPNDRAVVYDGSRTGLVLEDVEIDGGGRTDIGVDTSSTTIRRANIHGVNDGVRLGIGVTVEASWIHDLTRIGELHPDAIQGISAQDIVIRGNTLDPRNAVTGDRGNAAIMLGSETGPKVSKNVVIEGNWINGGNYSINIREDIVAEGFEIRDNRFGTDTTYGPILMRSTVTLGTGNVMDATEAPVQAVTRDG